jgi:hypothetical protein
MKTVERGKEKGDTERRYKVVNLNPKLVSTSCLLAFFAGRPCLRTPTKRHTERGKKSSRKRANQGMSTDKQLLHSPTEVATAHKSARSGGEQPDATGSQSDQVTKGHPLSSQKG